ncbi:PREDICTED: snRNA-activating protein complex subunit 3 [Lepidothrix coronata]|uniref:snRNA-activating protein complex subunit 3 n=1 Tax=Lepidothrix coronata TaxID=321398 RepID=A0A6J0J320_9PASS|nr:PREDICTED: snRNA-activating protein complex subunit 3 [Lepidothrix coronata]
MAEVAPEYESAELCTRAFRVGALGRGWRRQLGPPDLSLAAAQEEKEETDEAVAAELGCAADTAAELRAVCRWESRGCLQAGIYGAVASGTPVAGGGRCYPSDAAAVPQESLPLRIRKKALERREETIIVDRACRQETLAYEMESHAIGKRPDNPTDIVEEGELLLTLNIFYPVIFQKHKDHKPYQTVLVLGSQKLTELRDSISCVSDLQIGGEFSSQPDQAPEHISKDLYKSAFFYFEGIFYNDRRYPECRDLSRTVIEWSESHDRGYGNLQSVKMEDYVFNDVSLKIGFPYLFCHQGNCEHIIIITDIRLIHHDDCLDRNLYPLLIKKHWLCTRKCFVCKMYTARWVTNRDSLAPEDPCFFCDVCFRMLHYDAEGNKLGEFLAYPYVDPGIFN